MYKSILVPLDGSRLAEAALPTAIRLARRHSAQLELVNIEITMPTTVLAAGLSIREVAPPVLHDPAEAYLESVTRRIAEVYAFPVKHAIRTGYARGAPALLNYVKEAGTDLIVMATHGYGPVKRFWLGSFADAVARQSHIPTLLVRPTTEGVTDLHAEPHFKRVLVALDGSTASEKVLEHARAAADDGAEFVLFRAISPALPVGLDVNYLGVATDYPVGPLPIDEATMRARVEEARAELERAAETFRERKLQVTTEVAEHPFIASAILDYAERSGIDLIALTTHGHGGAVRLVLGSVADKVVRGAQVPVLLFRPPA